MKFKDMNDVAATHVTRMCLTEVEDVFMKYCASLKDGNSFLLHAVTNMVGNVLCEISLDGREMAVFNSFCEQLKEHLTEGIRLKKAEANNKH